MISFLMRMIVAVSMTGIIVICFPFVAMYGACVGIVENCFDFVEEMAALNLRMQEAIAKAAERRT